MECNKDVCMYENIGGYDELGMERRGRNLTEVCNSYTIKIILFVVSYGL
jgi:hypothetical protein